MSEEGFLRRWARRKTEVREGREPAPEALRVADLPGVPEALADGAAPATLAAAQPAALDGTPAPVAADAPAARPLPTLEDVAALDKDADFSAFVARGVDQAVRRGALKKLFADPHFKLMDGLDIYIDDYNKPSPMSEAMLASLEHAKSVFAKMIEDEPETPEEKAAPQQPPEQETQ